MPTYRMTIERAVRFQLDLEADSRLDALKKVTVMAFDYDVQDAKETRVIAIKELRQDDVHNPSD